MNPETTRRIVGGIAGGLIAWMVSPLYVDQSLPNIARRAGTFFGMAIGIGIGAFAAAPFGMQTTEKTTIGPVAKGAQ